MGVEERGLRGNLIWILGIKSFSCRGGQALELLRAGLESPSLEVLKTFWGCALVVTTAVLGFGDFGDIFQPFLPQVIPSPWSENQNFPVEKFRQGTGSWGMPELPLQGANPGKAGKEGILQAWSLHAPGLGAGDRGGKRGWDRT